MNYQKLSALALSLIGFYTIFSAILVSGMPFMTLVMAPFQNNGLEIAGYTFLALIPQFVVPIAFEK